MGYHGTWRGDKIDISESSLDPRTKALIRGGIEGKVEKQSNFSTGLLGIGQLIRRG